MYQNNTFGQILKLLDKEMISEIITSNKSDKHSKGFGTWNHLVVMLFSQLTGCRSLRDLEIRFNSKPQHHYHFNTSAVRKSTVSDANKNRNNSTFRDIALGLVGKQRAEITDLVSVLDSSIINVKSRGSEWAEKTKVRSNKGLKLHIQCGLPSDSIEHAVITATNINDITAAQDFSLESGKIYIFDKGYTSFNWWHKIASMEGYFVTRSKKNMAYKVVKELDISKCSTRIVRDSIVELTNKDQGGGRKNPLAGRALRLVEMYDAEYNRRYNFISNLFDESADGIANYYKQRWSVELIFKWLKQNLKLTKFLSENENAIKIQVYVSIVAYVLIGKLQRMSCGAFSRMIDVVSWIKIAIFSSHTHN